MMLHVRPFAGILVLLPAIAPAPKKAADDLPENTWYRDTGCSVSPSCLNCPLEQCRYDVPNGLITLKRYARDAEAVQLMQSGLTIEEIADRMHLTQRTVWRATQRYRLENVNG